jgi:2-(1,2-epoxy-1,2-dihydrophenyl)acetyl-CoA isomerase
VASDVVRLERSDGGRVAHVTLHRPEVRNAIDLRMRTTLADVFEALAADADLHAVVVTGAGAAFCAGGDVRELAGVTTRAQARHRVEAGNRMVAALLAVPVPTIAAVNGVAAGAGGSLALACDTVVMAAGASFRQSFLALGLAPDAGASYLLRRRLGPQRALHVALHHGRIDADLALELGLADAVVPDDALGTAVRACTDRAVAASRPALVATKRLLASTEDLQVALDAELEAQVALLDTPQHLDARAAFLAARPATDHPNERTA